MEGAPPLRVGLAGLGTVGQSVAALLVGDAAEGIAARAGRRIELKRVASRTPKPEVDIGGAPFATDLDSLLADDVDVVVELIGGDTTARELVSSALEAGKCVVTANKALLAACGDELFARAQRQGAPLGFEASVAGGIPIINALRTGLAANDIGWLAGIVNGTCNYILTQMAVAGQDFADALADAQRLGYAEADPTFDVEGIDAAQKLAILAALAFDTDIDIDGVHAEGIRGVDSEDIAYASELGFAIRHLGIARAADGGLEARVHPALVPHEVLLSKVDDVMNAVMVHGSAVGGTLHVGPGAGGMATASAVVADLIEAARGTLPIPKSASRHLPALGISSVRCPWYLKIPAEDQPGVLAHMAEVLGEHGISIEAVIQRPQAIRPGEAPWVPIVILTDEVAQDVIDDALKTIEKVEGVTGEVTHFRVVNPDALRAQGDA